MDEFYITFRVADKSTFIRIKQLFDYIKTLKNENDTQIEDLEYIIYDQKGTFFTDEGLAYFWHPTKEEAEVFWTKYSPLPDDKKEEPLSSVPWDFETVFSEIGMGEYELRNCCQIAANTYRLYFFPFSYPYGGTQPLEEILKAYGATITEINE